MTASAVGSYATAAELKRALNITDTVDDTYLGLICDRVNQYIETFCKQALCPISSATYLYDGNGLRRIFLPMPLSVTDVSPPAGSTLQGIGGLRTVTLVEHSPYTAGTFETIASTDYFLRGRSSVNGPYRWLVMSDKPAGTYSYFRTGISTVRITGAAGWSAIPDDVTDLALDIAKTAWNARQMSIGSEDSAPDIGNFVRGRHRETLWNYRLKMPV